MCIIIFYVLPTWSTLISSWALFYVFYVKTFTFVKNIANTYQTTFCDNFKKTVCPKPSICGSTFNPFYDCKALFTLLPYLVKELRNRILRIIRVGSLFRSIRVYISLYLQIHKVKNLQFTVYNTLNFMASLKIF